MELEYIYHTLTNNHSERPRPNSLRLVQFWMRCRSEFNVYKGGGYIMALVLAMVVPLVAMCFSRVWLTVLPVDCTSLLRVIVPGVWTMLTFLCFSSIVIHWKMDIIGLAQRTYVYIRERSVVSLVNRYICFTLFQIICAMSYNICVVWFVYQRWSYGFLLIIRLLEGFPTIALGMQGLCQGCFQLFVSTCPDVAKKHIQKAEDKQLVWFVYFHVVLNFSLFFHPLTMLCVAVMTGGQNIGTMVFEFCALLEVLSRICSTVYFHKRAKERLCNLEMQKHIVHIPNCTKSYTIKSVLQFCSMYSFTNADSFAIVQEPLDPAECTEGPPIDDIHPQVLDDHPDLRAFLGQYQ